MGIRVTRKSLRESIHRVDHANVIARHRSLISRRAYSVPYPNYIWHIDSHLKLIKWRYVIHGAIDGFSRTIVYLNCADNNRSSTPLDFFRSAVTQYGLPNLIRSDCGGENVAIWRYMIASHNLDYSSVLTGSSVHNERIERLWCDVRRCVVSVYADVFRKLEAEHRLDTLNEVDVYCLHFVFLPRINKCLSEFMESWNHHALSTEGNMSPFQLLYEGLNHLALNNQDSTSSNADTEVDVSSLVHDHVIVPRINFVPCSVLQQELQGISPLQSCNDRGVTLYTTAVHIAGQHLITNCDQCMFQ